MDAIPVIRIRPPSRGYTFVELVVAVGIFTLLLTGVASIFGTVVRSQRSSLSQTTMVGEVERFFEILEREVRTGYGTSFRCSSGPPIASSPPCSGPTFYLTNQNTQEMVYSVTAAGDLQRGPREPNQGPPVNVTSPEVQVRDLRFSVTQSSWTGGSSPGEDPILAGNQGRVTVNIRVCPRNVDDERCLVAQTTLTSRQASVWR